MHVVGHYVVEQTLVVRYHYGGVVRLLSWVTPEATSQGVDVETAVRFVEYGQLGSSIAIWNISLRFFSAGESSLTLREVSLESISTISLLVRISLRNSPADKGSSPLYFRFR